MKNKIYNEKYFYILTAGIMCLIGIFYAKFVNCANDIPLHTQFAEIMFSDHLEVDDNVPMQAYAYPVYHICVKLVHLILHIDYAAAAAVVISLSVLASILLYRNFMRQLLIKQTALHMYFIDFISIGAVVFVTARCWLNDWRFYALQCAANPVHNPTVIFVRPFAIVCMAALLNILKMYEKKKMHVGYLLAFGSSVFLSAAVKPSFAIVYLPAAALVIIYIMMKKRDIALGFYVFLAVMPTLLLLLMQRSYVTENTEMLNLKIQFGSFSQFQLLDVVLVSLVTFPVPLILFYRFAVKSYDILKISYLALVIAWVQMFFLTNGASGDFSWGYDLAVQFSTVITLVCSLNYENRKCLRYTAYMIFIYQVANGMIYIVRAYVSGGYWF